MSQKLLKSTATVSAMTMISRVLGFVRDVVIARAFGAGTGADAFFVAFKIPNFMRRLFAEGAFSQSFVPVLSEYKEQRAHEEVQSLAAHVSGTLGGILFLITLVGVLASPVLVAIFAPGFLDDANKFDLTVRLLRVTFPYLLFISLTALAGGILNSYGQFGVPAFTPVFLNLALIGAALLVAPYFKTPVTALAWGVFAAGVVQLLFQFPYLKKLHLLVVPRWGSRDEGVKRVVRLMLPAIFGSSVAQINLLLDTLIASFLITGSISWLYYSDRLVEFPLGVVGIALATVILPSLSKKHAQASTEDFSRTLDWALRWVMLIGLPATVGLFVLAGPVLSTLFQYGRFELQDVKMASLSLMAYSLGLLGFILVKILAPGFYARQDTRTPVKIGVIAMVSNMVMNVVFVVPMAYAGIPGPHAGLALATSLSAFVNAGLLFLALCKQAIFTPQPGWGLFAGRVLFANVVITILLVWVVPDISVWAHWTAWQRGLQLLLWLSLAVLVYFASLYSVGIRFKHMGKLGE
jgi:putative peptidoglycan lipid II flippase